MDALLLMRVSLTVMAWVVSVWGLVAIWKGR